MKTEIAYIYALIDPIHLNVRYVGKTIRPKERFKEHLKECLSLKTYKDKWLNKLKSKNLIPIFKVLKICSLSEFEKYEEFYIKKYQSRFLTNSDESGQGNKNRKRELVENSNFNRKIVYQYNLNGDFIQEYKSVRECSRQLNINHANITRCCNGISKHASGFIFRYDNNSRIEKIDNPNAIKKRVVEVDHFGNEINRWNSITDCSKELKLNYGNLSRACNGINRSVKGRYFKFLE